MIAPGFEAFTLVETAAGIVIVGRRCVMAADSGRTRCIAAPFRAVAAAAAAAAVYLMGDGNGDVHVFHHAGRVLLPPVLAASSVDTGCMARTPGRAVWLEVGPTTLTRHYAHASVASALAPPTATHVWRDYTTDGTATLPAPAPCPWHQWRDGKACVSRRPCDAVVALPAGADWRCGHPLPPKAAPRRRRATEDACTAPPTASCAPRPVACPTAPPTARRASVRRRPQEPQLAGTPFGALCQTGHFSRSAQCLPCAKCSAGNRLAQQCGPTTDTVCTACQKGSYMPDRWHRNTACLAGNGCPGMTRSQNGVCYVPGPNAHLLAFAVLPVYAALVWKLL